MIKKVTYKIGAVFYIFGLTIFILNALNIYENRSWVYPNVNFNLILLIVSSLFFLICFTPFAKYVHVICLWAVALLTFYENPEQGSANIQIILIAMLSYKYGFLKKHLIKKSIFSLCLVFLVISLSFYSKNKSILKFVPLILLYVVFLLTAFIIFSDEISLYLRREKRYKEQIINLKTILKDTDDYLKAIGEEYIDPFKAGLTNAELILLRTLCIYKESNEALSIRLNKSRHTIKNQLSTIMVKIGSESRHQLIDLCKNYFVDMGVSPPRYIETF